MHQLAQAPIAIATAVLLFVSIPAGAAPKLGPAATAYAKANKLPVRKVKINLPGRTIERIIVPVLPNTVNDFAERFSAEKGCLVWRKHNDDVHVTLNMGPKKFVTYQYGNANGYNAQIKNEANPNMANPHSGVYLTLALDKPMLAHFEKFLTTTGAKGANDVRKEFEGAGKKLYGGCMWWLVHGEVGKEQNLAHAMGVTRSQGPPNLLRKLIHAGNERVGPLGVAVPDVATFKKMTDAELLGAPPNGGAADAIR